jgi:hypothetical protein
VLVASLVGSEPFFGGGGELSLEQKRDITT